MRTKLLLFALLFAGSVAKLSAQCSAAFTFNVAPSGLATFTATGANAPSTIYSWNFGNATTGYGQNVSCVYTQPGTYNVCLIVVDTFSNCSDTVCQNVLVNAVFSCQAGFYIYEDSLAAPHTYIGVNTSIYPAGATFTWAWGDGTYGSGFNPAPHTYASAGMYNICVMISGGGCVDTFCSNENINKQTAEMLSVTFDPAPAAVQNIESTSLNAVYPNPSHGQLFIKGEKATTYQFDIYTISGVKVLSGQVNGTEAINVSALPTNLYLVKFSDEAGKRQYAKFTKQ